MNNTVIIAAFLSQKNHSWLVKSLSIFDLNQFIPLELDKLDV